MTSLTFKLRTEKGVMLDSERGPRKLPQTPSNVRERRRRSGVARGIPMIDVGGGCVKEHLKPRVTGVTSRVNLRKASGINLARLSGRKAVEGLRRGLTFCAPIGFHTVMIATMFRDPRARTRMVSLRLETTEEAPPLRMARQSLLGRVTLPALGVVFGAVTFATRATRSGNTGAVRSSIEDNLRYHPRSGLLIRTIPNETTTDNVRDAKEV